MTPDDIKFVCKPFVLSIINPLMLWQSHFVALESTSYVNNYSKTEILAFCYWHN